MMNSRTVKASVVSLLGTAGVGQFQVRGYQDQGISADEITGTNRLVQVFYQRGEFPKSASGRGPFTHDVTLRIELVVSSKATVDLSVLNNENSTSVQIAAALAALEPAVENADESMDELFELVYNVLMDGDNLDLGVGFYVANRWVTSFEKLEIIPRGEYAVLVGNAELAFRVTEEVPSTAEVGLDFIDTTLTLEDDEDEKAGVTEEY